MTILKTSILRVSQNSNKDKNINSMHQSKYQRAYHLLVYSRFLWVFVEFVCDPFDQTCEISLVSSFLQSSQNLLILLRQGNLLNQHVLAHFLFCFVCILSSNSVILYLNQGCTTNSIVFGPALFSQSSILILIPILSFGPGTSSGYSWIFSAVGRKTQVKLCVSLKIIILSFSNQLIQASYLIRKAHFNDAYRLLIVFLLTLLNFIQNR